MRLAGRLLVRICEDLCGWSADRADDAGHDASEKQLSDEQSRSVAALIREELARRRISRQLLADQAKISISTLEKALSGRRPFTLATTIRLEQALGVVAAQASADGARAAAPMVGVAPGDLGFYARPAVSWIEGDLSDVAALVRRPDAIYAYRTEICWDDELRA